MLNKSKSPIYIATRGSALALVQADYVLSQCRLAFPELDFQIRIIKTTGDKLQAAALAAVQSASTKGLFTKELEVALLNREADLAVHSLKDLPTDLPPGLHLAAVCKRADARDVLIYRSAESFAQRQNDPAAQQPRPQATEKARSCFNAGMTIKDLPIGATIGTSSTRRQAQIKAVRPDINIVPLRGNVGTRLRKLINQPEIDGIILAAAGLNRLQFEVDDQGRLHGHIDRKPSQKTASPLSEASEPQPSATGLMATFIDPDIMLPCVGQGAIGIETRKDDDQIAEICRRLDDYQTHQCVLAERAFLHVMGGGCQSPVAAYAQVIDNVMRLRAVSFREEPARWIEIRGPLTDAIRFGVQAGGTIK